uniref:Uncharacterized protein n=1 Tax=Trichinella nativa TaxID=6335 RepID=A0A0V1KIP7_9BILA
MDSPFKQNAPPLKNSIVPWSQGCQYVSVTMKPHRSHATAL